MIRDARVLAVAALVCGMASLVVVAFRLIRGRARGGTA